MHWRGMLGFITVCGLFLVDRRMCLLRLRLIISLYWLVRHSLGRVILHKEHIRVEESCFSREYEMLCFQFGSTGQLSILKQNSMGLLVFASVK